MVLSVDKEVDHLIVTENASFMQHVSCMEPTSNFPGFHIANLEKLNVVPQDSLKKSWANMAEEESLDSINEEDEGLQLSLSLAKNDISFVVASKKPFTLSQRCV